MFLCFTAAAPAAFAEKFQSSFSQDALTQSNQQDLKQQIPSAPAMPANPTPASAPAAMEETSVPKTPSAIPASLPQMQTGTTPAIPQAQQNIQVPVTHEIGPMTMPQAKITVPDYEKRFNEMFLEQAKAAKKKKKLIDAIMDEVTKYGFYMILAFVVLLTVYALRKEEPGAPSGEKPPGEEDKKDIWKDF